MVDCNTAYLTSLLKDISEVRTQAEGIEQQVVVSTATNPVLPSGLTVISMNPLDGISSSDQIVELSNEQLVGHGKIIHCVVGSLAQSVRYIGFQPGS